MRSKNCAAASAELSPGCSFGGAGGAAGQHHEVPGVRRVRQARLGCPGDQLLEGGHGAAVDRRTVVHPGQIPVHLGRQGRSKGGELLVEHHRGDPFARTDVAQLGACEPRVHQHHAGTELARRDHRLELTAVVSAQHRDHRLGGDAALRKRRGQTGGAAVDLTEGQRSQLVHDPGLARVSPRSDLKSPGNHT